MTHGLKTLLAWAALLMLPLTPAQAQQDWRPCAAEGEVCSFDGEALVRYGVPGSYVFRNARYRVECSTQAFGSDPAKGVAKRCEVSRNWREDPQYRGWRDPSAALPAGTAGSTWRFCAAEGGDCVLRGAGRVRFGADGRYNTRQVQDRVACNVSTFRDPAPGQPKICEYEEVGPVWRPCASEGDICRFEGTQTVRYGVNGRYAERTATGSMACHNGSFGDPAPGVAKQCEVSGGGSSMVVGSPLVWDTCAREGDPCAVRGAAMLRYGATGRYYYREVTGTFNCRNEEFGGDPAPGTAKHCEVLRR